jgi:putative transposase
LRLFKKPEDFAAFNRILIEAHQRHPIRILDWCLMPNHWHFVVYPRKDHEVTAFFKWLTHAHAMRAITHRRVMGMGPLYQGRFKSLPVEADEHLETLLRYVGRNPVRAKLVTKASQWQWSGQWTRRHGDQAMMDLLSPWPIEEPANWDRWLAIAPDREERATVREHIQRSRPFGAAGWTANVVRQLNLEWTMRARGGYRRNAQSAEA